MDAYRDSVRALIHGEELAAYSRKEIRKMVRQLPTAEIISMYKSANEAENALYILMTELDRKKDQIFARRNSPQRSRSAHFRKRRRRHDEKDIHEACIGRHDGSFLRIA